MSSKPAQVRYVQGGKSLGAAMHKGWAATWNWVLSWIVHFAGGKGCKIVNGEKGHPRIDVLIAQGDGIEVTGGGDGEAYTISLSGADGGGDDSGSGDSGSDDVVTSLNSGTGDMDIIGGESIRVDTDGKTIRVSFEEGKAPDDDPHADDDSGEDGYCNSISDDFGDGGTGGGIAFGLGENEISQDLDNGLSLDPCNF